MVGTMTTTSPASTTTTTTTTSPSQREQLHQSTVAALGSLPFPLAPPCIVPHRARRGAGLDARRSARSGGGWTKHGDRVTPACRRRPRLLSKEALRKVFGGVEVDGKGLEGAMQVRWVGGWVGGRMEVGGWVD